MFDSEAEKAHRDYQIELDKETARIIREEGLPLWDAIDEAKRVIRRRRRLKDRYGRRDDE